MDYDKYIKEVPTIVDCATLNEYVLVLISKFDSQTAELKNALAEVVEEIAACTTPFTYVAWKLKKLKEKQQMIIQAQQDLQRMLSLINAIKSQMEKVGCKLR